MSAHRSDEECTVVDGACAECLVQHGLPCLSCGRRAFHLTGCPDSDETVDERARAAAEAERAAREPEVEAAVREILNRHGPNTQWSLDTLREVQALLYPSAQC